MNLVKRVETLEAKPLMRIVPAEPVPLDHPADVLALLVEQVNAVRADVLADPTERARTLGMLASLALRAMEARDITARLEAVERILKVRRQSAQEIEEAKRKRRWERHARPERGQDVRPAQAPGAARHAT